MEPKTEEQKYSTMMTPTNHGTLNPSLNPNNHYYDNQETHNPHQTITNNVVNHVINNNNHNNNVGGNNNSTFVANPNEHDRQETHNNNVANHVINNVACNNGNVSNDDDVGLTKEEWPYEYPPGYRFCPEDEELIQYYLKRRIMNLKLPHSKIKDVNLYLTTPDKVTAEHAPVGDKEWYFFTPRDRKYRNGTRPNRATAGTGYWKATGADKEIKVNGVVVGYRKALVFYNGKAPKGVKTNWIMHEFKVKEVTERQRIDEHDMRLDDYVLCRIYNKNDKGSKSNKTNVENDNPKSEESEETNIPNSSSANNSLDNETHAKPEMVDVVEEEKKPALSNPNIDNFIQEAEYYNIFYGDDQESLFSSLNFKNTFEYISMYSNDDFQANGFFNSEDKGEHSWQESMLVPVEQINNVSTFQDTLDWFQVPNVNGSRSITGAPPSRRWNNVEFRTSGDDAQNGPPSRSWNNVELGSSGDKAPDGPPSRRWNNIEFGTSGDNAADGPPSQRSNKEGRGTSRADNAPDGPPSKKKKRV